MPDVAACSLPPSPPPGGPSVRKPFPFPEDLPSAHRAEMTHTDPLLSPPQCLLLYRGPGGLFAERQRWERRQAWDIGTVHMTFRGQKSETIQGKVK